MSSIAVAVHAYREALARARIMAAAAHLKAGGVIAVNDAGAHDGALCGYGKSAPALRNAGAMPDHLQLRSTACESAQAAALRAATLGAIARAGAQPLQALVDRGSVYRPARISQGRIPATRRRNTPSMNAFWR